MNFHNKDATDITGEKRIPGKKKEYILTPYGEIYSECWRDRKKNVENNNNLKNLI